MKKIKCNKGQGLIEYLIVVAMIGIAAISITQVLSRATNFKLAQVANTLLGRTPSQGLSAPDAPSDTHFKKKDFSNFMRGITTPDRKQKGQSTPTKKGS